MEQKKNIEIKFRKRLRFLFAFLCFCSAVSLLGDAAAWLIGCMGGISFPVRQAATIGIIGGADGPTAIFLTASKAPGWKILSELLLLGGSLLGWHHMKK